MGDSSEEEIIDEYDECPSGRVKDLVHKSHSDPGNRNAAARQVRHHHHHHPLPTGPTTRKCVLTLDGYSYVIGKAQNAFKISSKFISLNNLHKIFNQNCCKHEQDTSINARCTIGQNDCVECF